jgi:nitrous oxidase accessory protein NosD
MSGFIVDGNGEFNIGAFSMAGIWWENSGGIITGNVVRNITRYGNSAHGYGIEITNSTDTVRNLTVTKNALVHSQQVGIYASGNTVVKISKNRVSMTQFLGDESSAIMLDGAADGASVDGNTLLGDWRPGIPYVAYGITIDSTSKAKVSKNNITELPMGIYLKDSDCASPLDTVDNTISGNVLVDNQNGIYLESVGGALCESHVDGTKITNNKVYSHYDDGDANMGIMLFTSGAPPVSNTTLTGNQVMGTFNEHIIDVGSVGTVGLIPQKNKIGPMPPPGM